MEMARKFYPDNNNPEESGWNQDEATIFFQLLILAHMTAAQVGLLLIGHKRADFCKENKDQENKNSETVKAAINAIDEECKSEEARLSELGFVGKDELKKKQKEGIFWHMPCYPRFEQEGEDMYRRWN